MHTRIAYYAFAPLFQTTPRRSKQLLALGIHLGGPGLAGDHGHVALGLAGRHFQLARFLIQTQQVGRGGDGGDEVFAGMGSVGLELGFVHVSAV
jgi:hypothetical protein